MRIRGLLSAALCILMAAHPGSCQEGNTGGKAAEVVFTDPEKAGDDFKLQGEYEGDSPVGKLGAQAVAKGDGKFDVNFLTGGLPGAGWDGKTKVQTSGAIDKTINSARLAVPLVGNGWSGMLRNGNTLDGKTADGKVFTLKKVMRHSPNEGAKAPEGATVLFDGTNTDQWQDGKIVEGNLLKWGAHSKKAFGDLKVHLEFRLPFKPKARGQERGNSGVKLQERYEIQVLDSFGLKGDQHECGAVYTQTAPLVNMCYPPLSWQTYDIDFKAARYDANGKKTANAVVSVVQNGVPVQNNTEIKNKTGASKAESPAPLPLELQDHGNPVVFRNVWIVEPK